MTIPVTLSGSPQIHSVNFTNWKIYFEIDDRLTLCQKASQEAEKQPFRDGYIPKCKSDGRFEEIQCLASQKVCWCVDQAGNEIQGTRTSSNNLRCPSAGSFVAVAFNPLNYKREITYIPYVFMFWNCITFKTGGEVNDCHQEYQLKTRYWLFYGRRVPRCTSNGMYAHRQCYQESCYCVNEQGIEIHGTRKSVTKGREYYCPSKGGYAYK